MLRLIKQCATDSVIILALILILLGLALGGCATANYRTVHRVRTNPPMSMMPGVVSIEVPAIKYEDTTITACVPTVDVYMFSENDVILNMHQPAHGRRISVVGCLTFPLYQTFTVHRCGQHWVVVEYYLTDGSIVHRTGEHLACGIQ